MKIYYIVIQRRITVKINISESAQHIMDMLTNAGYKAYVIGGCVRDCLLSKMPHDIDITTNATPDEVKVVLNAGNIKTIDTGLKHGTITAVINDEPYEITTFRIDGEYKDNRRPETVEFTTDIVKDLARRDFTMNAIAYNKAEGFIDPFGGCNDIQSKVIKAVGDPNQRFREDALRIMRAIRFASVFNFKIEAKTKEAIFTNKELLRNIAVERLYKELCTLLVGANVKSVLDEYKEVIAVIIPEIAPMFNCEQNHPWHIYNVWNHTTTAVASAPKNDIIRLALLLHDIGKPSVVTVGEDGITHFLGHGKESVKIAEQILKRMRVSNRVYNEVITLVEYHDAFVNADNVNVKRLLSKLGEDYMRDLLEVCIADNKGQNPELANSQIETIRGIGRKIDEIIASEQAFQIKDLAINGFDLINLGFKGPIIGEILDDVLENVVNEELTNGKDEILHYIKEKYIITL